VFFLIKTGPGKRQKKKKKTIWAATKFQKSKEALMGTKRLHS
jgi:hypothetical protein